MTKSLQQLANESGRKVYVYRVSDFSIDHSFEYLCPGDMLNGLMVLELMGAFVPQATKT